MSNKKFQAYDLLDEPIIISKIYTTVKGNTLYSFYIQVYSDAKNLNAVDSKNIKNRYQSIFHSVAQIELK